MQLTPFYSSLAQEVKDLGGYHNAHLHLDRVYTLDQRNTTSTASKSLSQKHALISDIHRSEFYQPANLTRRVSTCLDHMIACGTRRADTVVDVTDDGLGLTAISTMKSIAVQYKDQIDLRNAVYSPLGFKRNDQSAWDLFEEGAKLAHFVGCLPERDDTVDYPDHIGFEECCARMLDITRRYQTFVHVHTDQMNVPNECATERLLDVVENEGPLAPVDGAPAVWAIHAISPSTYDEQRFQRLCKRMKELDVGVICCPSGALGMRQIRGFTTPTFNSIARVLDFLAHGIPVRLGCDNICDMLSPSTTPNLGDEVFFLSAALRFYDINILSKLACGQLLNADEISMINEHLESNNVEMAKAKVRWQ